MKKIIKKLTIFSLLSLALFFLSGCNSNSIVGTWNYYKDGNVTDNIYYTFERGEKGSYSYAGNVKNFTYEDRGNKVLITFEGNTVASEFDYSISDGILTIKDSYGSDITYKRK